MSIFSCSPVMPVSAAVPVSIVIPVWNLWDMTRACLVSLAEHTPPELFDLWIVDNGSSDATREELEPLGRALFGARFHCIRFAENHGFAIACNEGARQAAGDCVFFLNNDTLALPGWLPPLYAGWTDGPADTGAVGPLLLYEGGERVQHAGVAFTYGGVQHLYSQFPATHPVLTKTRRFQALTAAALLMSRLRFLEMGMFHEGYRNGYEDVELCWHLSRAGYGLYCLPQSRMIHRESMTPGRKTDEGRNAALLAARCPISFERDMYDLVADDGFAICLGEALETRISLPAREEARVQRESKGASTAALWQLLERYPVWQGGYAQLGERLMQESQYEQCLLVRSLACNLFPSLAAYAELEEAALAGGRTDLFAQARSGAVRRRAQLADKEGLRRKAVTQGRWARRDGRQAVEALYLEWLRRFGA